jgi:hypothetical protein
LAPIVYGQLPPPPPPIVYSQLPGAPAAQQPAGPQAQLQQLLNQNAAAPAQQ